MGEKNRIVGLVEVCEPWDRWTWLRKEAQPGSWGHHTIQAKIGVEEQLSSQTRPVLQAKCRKRTALLVSWRCANLGIAGLVGKRRAGS